VADLVWGQLSCARLAPASFASFAISMAGYGFITSAYARGVSMFRGSFDAV
jgi:hypothetical protein